MCVIIFSCWVMLDTLHSYCTVQRILVIIVVADTSAFCYLLFS